MRRTLTIEQTITVQLQAVVELPDDFEAGARAVGDTSTLEERLAAFGVEAYVRHPAEFRALRTRTAGIRAEAGTSDGGGDLPSAPLSDLLSTWEPRCSRCSAPYPTSPGGTCWWCRDESSCGRDQGAPSTKNAVNTPTYAQSTLIR